MANPFDSKFIANDWVEVEDIALGLRAIGKVKAICADSSNHLYYSIEWHIIECSKTQGIQPTSLYPLRDFDRKGRSCPAGEVLYGGNKKFSGT